MQPVAKRIWYCVDSVSERWSEWDLCILPTPAGWAMLRAGWGGVRTGRYTLLLEGAASSPKPMPTDNRCNKREEALQNQKQHNNKHKQKRQDDLWICQIILK